MQTTDKRLSSLLGVVKNPSRVFYGWWIVVAGTLAATVYSAVFSVGFGAYFLAISKEFSSGRAALSGVYSMVRVEAGLLGPAQGLLLDKFGPRKVMLVGYALFGLGFILLSNAHSLVVFYAFFAVTAVGASLSGFLSLSATVVNWFNRRRAMTLGIMMAGTSLGGVFVPILTWSITSFGWRPTFVGVGIFVWLIGVPISMVMRHRPEQYGTTPDGDPVRREAYAGSSLEQQRPNQPGEQNFTIRDALKTQAFWVMGSAHGLSVMVWSAVTVHQIAALVEVGISETAAATVLSVTAGVMAVGRLLGGVAGDLVGRKLALLACFLMQSTGLAVLSVATGLWQAYVVALLVGLGFGARGPLLVALRGDYFGRKAYGTISGSMEMLITSGSIVAPLFAGYLYDVQGSYSFAFLTIAGASLIGAVLILLMRTPVLKDEATTTALRGHGRT